MAIPASSGNDPQFTEQLNFRVTRNIKILLASEAERLDMTQGSLARLCLKLGLEAMGRLHTGGGTSGDAMTP